jgi:hypothetical protein
MKRLLKLYRESDLGNITSWQEGVNLCVDRCTDYYNRHPMAMELILGSGVSREIQIADRTNNQLLAEQAGLFLSESTGMETPEGLLKRLEISLDIADAIWRHSYFEHRCITPFYISESKIALTSYMEQYLPRRSY